MLTGPISINRSLTIGAIIMTTQFATAAKNFGAAVPAMLAGQILGRATPAATHWHDTPGMSGALQTLSRDQEIYGESDKAEHFFKIVSGVVRTCKFLSDGRRQIIAFYKQGDIFGVEANDRHRLSAEAISDCNLVAYRRRNLETIAAGNDGVARQLFLYAMGNAARAQDHTLLLGRRSAVEKVTSFLLDWVPATGGQAKITLEMPRQDIADYLGLTVETVSRTLSKLERDGIIELATARNIRIKNFAALRAFND